MDLTSLGLNKLDFAILIFIALFCLLGFIKGAVRQFFSILVFVLASVISVIVPYFVSLPLGVVVSPLVGHVILTVLIWIPAYLILNSIARCISSRMLRDGISLGDRIWGLGFGCLKGTFIIVLIIFVIEPLSGSLEEAMPVVPVALRGSRFVRTVARYNPLSKFRILQNLQMVLMAVNDPEVLETMEEDEQFQDLIRQESIQAVLDDSELQDILSQRQYIKFITHPKVQQLLTDKEALKLLANVQIEAVKGEEIEIEN